MTIYTVEVRTDLGTWSEIDEFEGRGARGAADLHAKVKTIADRKPHRVVKKDVIVLYRPKGTS